MGVKDRDRYFKIMEIINILTILLFILLSIALYVSETRTLRKWTKMFKVKIQERRSGLVIVRDSHTRKCAENVKENLKNLYEVIGYVNPGAETGEIIKSAKSKSCLKVILL